MRLTCPNCGAQYEVPDEVIPQAGRDVQCSNCGDTWFQHHPNHEPMDEGDAADAPHPGWDSPPDEPDAEADEADAEPEAVPDPEDDPVPEPEGEAEAEPEDEPDSEPEAEFDAVDEVSDEDQDEGEPELERDSDLEADLETPPRRQLDPEVADLLREEATREQDARTAEATSDAGNGLETQPDLGLNGVGDDNDQRSQQAKARMARLRGQPEEPEVEPEPEPNLDPGSRRNLLPDIEEINSSLSSESSRAEMAQAASEEVEPADLPIRKTGGFRRGFVMVVVVVVLLIGLYMLAPTLAEKIPALEGVLSSYVDMINGVRNRLNDWVTSTVAPASE